MDKDWRVVQQVCFAIGNVAFIGDFEQLIMSEKGIEFVLIALEKYPKQSLLLTDAIFFLKNLAYGETGRNRIISNGGIPKILKVMKDNMEHPELLELAINILFDLSFSGGVDVLMCTCEGINLIVQIMNTHQTDLNLIREALRTIIRIYSKCTLQQKVSIIKGGVVNALQKVLVNHASHNYLVRLVRGTFALFAEDKIVHEKTPTTSVLSLVELAAKSIADNHPLISPLVLPQELKQYLDNEVHFCDLCGKSYFEHKYEVISYEAYPQYFKHLPTFRTVCSRQCFDKARIKI